MSVLLKSTLVYTLLFCAILSILHLFFHLFFLFLPLHLTTSSPFLLFSLLMLNYDVKNYCSRYMLTIIILEMPLVYFLDHNDTNSANFFKWTSGRILCVCFFVYGFHVLNCLLVHHWPSKLHHFVSGNCMTITLHYFSKCSFLCLWR